MNDRTAWAELPLWLGKVDSIRSLARDAPANLKG
jgi:hypothetical protein